MSQSSKRNVDKNTADSSQRAKFMQGGIKIGEIFGISVVLDWSLLIIAFLIATTVSMGPLAQWHEEWSVVTRWLVGISAAVLLFASVLIHEFSHALMGRRYGSTVNRITLFIFGGMAHLEGEPKHWRAELIIAAVGPLTSMVLGLLFLGGASFYIDPNMISTDSPQALFSSLGVLPTLLLWAGNINIILAVFNLVPAYPLDGGRILRAVLWGITGNPTWSTQHAAMGGRFFGWLLVTAGIAMVLGLNVPFFGQGVIGGLWLIFIGWFLARIALLNYQDAGIKKSLAQVSVREIMRTDFEKLGPRHNVNELVEDFILPTGQQSFPVIDDKEELIGMVSFDDVRKIPRKDWRDTSIGQIMTPWDDLQILKGSDDGYRAFEQLSSKGVNQMPVLSERQTIGLLNRDDILRWLALFRREPVTIRQD